jgi:O-acetyl-ADP-ribose deacetylase
MDEWRLSGTRFVLVRGDITEQDVDAIVNAANSTLLGGGGVDGAIHRRGGPAILEACRELRRTEYPSGMPAGDAAVTPAGKLAARYVIHTVGPIWHGGRSGEADVLAAAYRNSLARAAERGLRTIAFPAISTGAYGYPIEEAAGIALGSARDTVEARPGVFQEIRFVLFRDADLSAYRAAASSFEWTADRSATRQ